MAAHNPPLTTKPEALIFDMGNVVAHFDFARARARLSQLTGVGMVELVGRAIEADLKSWIVEFEHGRVDEITFARESCARLRLRVAPEAFCECWADIFWLNEPVAALVADLDRNGYRLVLGSNTNVIHSRHFRRQFEDTLARFDALVLSHEIGFMKPAPEFYARCAEAAGIGAAACVFVDDLLENIEGARRFGMHAIHYTDVTQLTADLLRLGIEMPDALDERAPVVQNG